MGGRMSPKDRETWLLRRIQEEPGQIVDVCNQQFVDDYVDATGARHRPTMYGAVKCAQLGRDLSRMATRWGPSLKRARTSLGDMGTGMGFPRWVWSYRVHPAWTDAGRAALQSTPEGQ